MLLLGLALSQSWLSLPVGIIEQHQISAMKIYSSRNND